MVRLLTMGDGGDAIACLPILRQLGGGDLVMTQGRNPRSFRAIAQMLIPLFKSQPYVNDAVWEDAPQGITHDTSMFRPTHYKPTRTLAESQAAFIGVSGLDLSPWLEINPNPRSSGKIVIARTKRYNNNVFPWRKVLLTYRPKLLFLGLDEERFQLEHMTGFKIEHFRIKDFLEAAQIIAGSELLISNQSSPYWLAAGMGHPLVQETEMVRKIHDSQVPRVNSVFLKDSNFPFADLPKKVKWEYIPNYEI